MPREPRRDSLYLADIPDMAPNVLALLRTEDPEIAAKFGPLDI